MTVQTTGANEAWFRAVAGPDQLAGVQLRDPSGVGRVAEIVLDGEAGSANGQLQLKALEYLFAPTSWWGSVVAIKGTSGPFYGGWSTTKDGAAAGSEGGVRYEYASQKIELLAGGDVRATVDSAGLLVATSFSGDGSALTNLSETDPDWNACEANGGAIAGSVSSKCPSGTAEYAGYCIEDHGTSDWTQLPGPGNLDAAMDDCNSKGMELVSLDALSHCWFGAPGGTSCGLIGNSTVDVWRSTFDRTAGQRLYLEESGASFNNQTAAVSESKHWLRMTRAYHKP